MGNRGRWEYLKAIFERYRKAARREKQVILNEFCVNSGYHRKYAIRFAERAAAREAPQASAAAWADLQPADREGADRRAGGRGVSLVGATEGAVAAVDAVDSQTLLGAAGDRAGAFADQCAADGPALESAEDRAAPAHLRAHQARHLLKQHIPVKTDRWDVQNPGFTEVDLVSHSGNSASGEFAYTLNVTDIHTTWTEFRAVLGRGEEAVQRALNEVAGVLPFALLGVDSDNGSEFINWHLKNWCEQRHIQLTRGRPYKKDDNAHVEQKNWTHARKLLGWDRYDTHETVALINDLYCQELRLWMNRYLPSVKFVKKVRVGSKVRRVYDGPRTPFERVRECAQAHAEKVAQLEQLRKRLDPFQLSRSTERKLERISRLANRRLSPNAKPETVPGLAATGRGNGRGKDATLGNPAPPAGFPLSHHRNNNKASVTFQMSRQLQLRLHSQMA